MTTKIDIEKKRGVHVCRFSDEDKADGNRQLSPDEAYDYAEHVEELLEELSELD